MTEAEAIKAVAEKVMGWTYLKTINDIYGERFVYSGEDVVSKFDPINNPAHMLEMLRTFDGYEIAEDCTPSENMAKVTVFRYTSDVMARREPLAMMFDPHLGKAAVMACLRAVGVEVEEIV